MPLLITRFDALFGRYNPYLEEVVECVRGTGQGMVRELTGRAGLSEDESHDPASLPQHRVQTAGGAGVHRWRDPSRSGIRHFRPAGLSIAQGCRLMGIPRSTFYDAHRTAT